ncbi:MAG: septation protein IspZ [Pseudomonadota bacterium]
MFSWKLICEYIPFIVFFLSYKLSDMFFAVALKLSVALIFLVISYLIDYNLSYSLLFSSVMMFIFGFLTLFFQDADFIMMQPTILYIVMGLISIIGSLFGYYITSYVLRDILNLSLDLSLNAHRFLSYGGGVVLLVLAGVNELIRFKCTENDWMNYKIMLFPPITILLIILLFLLGYTCVFNSNDIKSIFQSGESE